MINVTQKSEREFIIEWDENDPQESIFNAFTEKDFIEVLTYYAEKSLVESKYTGKSIEESRETYYNSESEGLSSEEIYQAAFDTTIYHQNNSEAP